jgi:selenocysteine lyase/cysteine desulfurase
VSLEGVDAFATGVHKALLSPQGPGLLWTRRDLRERLAPLGSWLSVEGGDDPRRFNTDHDRPWRDDGRRLEFACPSPLAHAALGASLELLATTGATTIAAHVAALQRELLAALGRTPGLEAEAERLAGLLEKGRLGSFLGVHHGGRGSAWLNAVLELGQRERIYATAREGYLRLAFHGWHEAADLDRLTGWLRRAPAAHQ